MRRGIAGRAIVLNLGVLLRQALGEKFSLRDTISRDELLQQSPEAASFHCPRHLQKAMGKIPLNGPSKLLMPVE